MRQVQPKMVGKLGSAKANKVVQTGGILYAKNAPHIVRDRLELEGKEGEG